MKDDLTAIESHFATLAERHGNTPAAAQWSDAQTQRRRFQVLTEIGDLREAAVLDFGCGTGALLDYLREEHRFVGTYVGYDLADPAVAIARANHQGATFERRNIFTEGVPRSFEYVLMSGVFNIRVGDNWGLLTSALRALWPQVTRGMSFNLLSLYVDWRQEDLWYADPAEVWRFCKEELSPAVALRHDYETREGVLPYEFTIYVRRSPHRARPRLR